MTKTVGSHYILRNEADTLRVRIFRKHPSGWDYEIANRTPGKEAVIEPGSQDATTKSTILDLIKERFGALKAIHPKGLWIWKEDIPEKVKLTKAQRAARSRRNERNRLKREQG